MTKKLEDYELIPESEVSDKNKTIYEKWRNKWRKANEEFFENDPTSAETQLEEYITHKRKSALKKADDRKEYDGYEKEGKLSELSEDNFFHPKNTVGGVAGHDSVDVVDVDSQNAGMKINMRPQLAVNIMKVEFPEEILVELNDHVDTMWSKIVSSGGSISNSNNSGEKNEISVNNDNNLQNLHSDYLLWRLQRQMSLIQSYCENV